MLNLLTGPGFRALLINVNTHDNDASMDQDLWPLDSIFTAIAPDSVTVMPDIATHLSLVIKLFFVVGLAFEIPVATVILIVAGVITPKGLADKRPYVIVACFVVGMLLPPDVFSQPMLAIPTWMLFEICVFFGKLAIRGRKEDADEVVAE
jgi:sec-independent protein translocase protein TatC